MGCMGCNLSSTEKLQSLYIHIFNILYIRYTLVSDCKTILALICDYLFLKFKAHRGSYVTRG